MKDETWAISSTEAGPGPGNEAIGYIYIYYRMHSACTTTPWQNVGAARG